MCYNKLVNENSNSNAKELPSWMVLQKMLPWLRAAGRKRRAHRLQTDCGTRKQVCQSVLPALTVPSGHMLLHMSMRVEPRITPSLWCGTGVYFFARTALFTIHYVRRKQKCLRKTNLALKTRNTAKPSGIPAPMCWRRL